MGFLSYFYLIAKIICIYCRKCLWKIQTSNNKKIKITEKSEWPQITTIKIAGVFSGDFFFLIIKGLFLREAFYLFPHCIFSDMCISYINAAGSIESFFLMTGIFNQKISDICSFCSALTVPWWEAAVDVSFLCTHTDIHPSWIFKIQSLGAAAAAVAAYLLQLISH